MTQKKSMNDKGRRPLTRAARAGRNPDMSAKRPPAPPSAGKTKTTKALGKKVAGKVAASTAPADAVPSPVAKPDAARGAKAVAKTKPKVAAKAGAKAKAKLRAVSGSLRPAASPDLVAKRDALQPASGAAKPRPRLRQLGSSKRVGSKRSGMSVALARFAVGDVVRHKIYPFRGVIFDIDPVFANTDDWWLSIPEPMRPKKNQPFYHLLAENTETEYIAYVSEQNLLPDTTGVPVRHPQVTEYFVEDEEGRYRPVFMTMLN